MSYARHLPVLMYHHVSDKPGQITLSPRTFRAQMKWLAESGWKTVTAAEVEAFYHGARLPRKSVMLTFDGGWLDNWLQVFPVLQEFNLHAHLFLVTSLISDGPVRIPAGEPVYSHDECQMLVKQGRLMRSCCAGQRSGRCTSVALLSFTRTRTPTDAGTRNLCPVIRRICFVSIFFLVVSG